MASVLRSDVGALQSCHALRKILRRPNCHTEPEIRTTPNCHRPPIRRTPLPDSGRKSLRFRLQWQSKELHSKQTGVLGAEKRREVYNGPHLSRALHNLVANAVQHTPSSGWIEVTTEMENGQLQIAVEDCGSGVPDELKEKIFEPFVTSCCNGSGLGLAIAREIVEAHGGTLECVNSRIGARFEIRLPQR